MTRIPWTTRIGDWVSFAAFIVLWILIWALTGGKDPLGRFDDEE